jgi:hypothetical protein
MTTCMPASAVWSGGSSSSTRRASSAVVGVAAETKDGGPRFRSEGSTLEGERKQGPGTGPFDEELVEVLQTCLAPRGRDLPPGPERVQGAGSRWVPVIRG